MYEKEAERRQITVLFSDLVGSTALANEIDPEEMSALIRRYQDACAGAIPRFDGFIAKFMGDGVLAYFGYPQAQEDAAERSVYAALAIIGSLRQLKGPDGGALETRVGIATGVVVIGDIIGSGAAREPWMGKSRIVDALFERIVDDHYYHLIFQCSHYHTNSALHPVIGQFERSAGFTLEDSAAIKLEKLEALLSATDNLSGSTRSLFA